MRRKVIVILALVGFTLTGACSTNQNSLVSRDDGPHGGWKRHEQADRALMEGGFDLAIALYKRFIQDNPGNGLAWYHLGYAYGHVGQHTQEVACYEKAIGLGFQRKDVYFNLGMAYLDVGDPNKSIDAFNTTLKMDKKSADSYFGLAVAHQRNGNGDIAEEQLLKAIEVDPAHLEARLNLSWLYTEMGCHEKAIKEYRKILKIDPDNTTAQESLKRFERR